MASARKSYPKRSNYSVQDLIEYLGEKAINYLILVLMMVLLMKVQLNLLQKKK